MKEESQKRFNSTHAHEFFTNKIRSLQGSLHSRTCSTIPSVQVSTGQYKIFNYTDLGRLGFLESEFLLE